MSNKIILLIALGLISSEANEIPEPLKTPSVVRSYTVQVQPNGVTIFPKFVPFLKEK